jgi:hypothetical protein
MEWKRIVVLANSVKHWPGRCIAGREMIAVEDHLGRLGPWIRPVSPAGEAEDGELLPGLHCELDVRGMPRLLEVVEVPLRCPRNDPGQPENWEVEPNVHWRKCGQVEAEIMARHLDEPPDLWLRGEREHLDRVPSWKLRTRPNESSLALIRAQRFRIEVWKEWDDRRGRERFHSNGVFCYRGVEYSLSITDDGFTHRYCPKGDEVRRTIVSPFSDGCLLCISLGGDARGYHHKSIQGVIPLAQ